MKIYDLTNRKFKTTVIKILIKVKRVMYKQTETFNRDGRYKNVPSRNHTTEDYNGLIKKETSI
jgi:hypothetical protein